MNVDSMQSQRRGNYLVGKPIINFVFRRSGRTRIATSEHISTGDIER